MALTERYVTSTGTDTYANSTNIVTPMSLTTALGAASAGDRINVKAGSYAQGTAAQTATNGGTVTSPIIYRGYNSTIGDGYLGRTVIGGALVTTNFPVITYTTTTGRIAFGAFTLLECLSFAGAPSNPTLTMSTDGFTRACKSINSSTNASAAAVGMGARSVFFDSDFELTGASGGSCAVTSGTAGNKFIYCRVKGGPAGGIASSNSPVVIGCTIFASAGNGLTISGTGGQLTALFNTIVGNTLDGINIITANTLPHCIIGNMITDNSGDGIDMVSTSNSAFAALNRTRDNTNGYNNAGDWLTATKYSDVTTDTGGPETDYVTSGSNDYRLIPTSPGRLNTTFPYFDLGALQLQQQVPSFTFS